MNNYCKYALSGLLLATLAASRLAYGQTDTVTIKRPAELREAPGENARSLGALPVQTPVTRLTARQGPWIEVRTAQGATGWIHMFDVGTALPAQGGNTATGALRGLTGFFGKGSSQAPAATSGTSTIGIRGLGAEDIANAQPNLAAVAQVESMRLDTQQARNFSVDAALTAQTVAALPVPAPPNQPAAGNSRPGQPGAPRTSINDR